MKQKNKVVLFDMDGTLIDSPHLIMNSFKESIRKHTNYKPTKKEVTFVLGSTLHNAFVNYSNDEKHLDLLIETFINYSNENTLAMLKPYKNAKNVIQYLRDKNYLVGIVTSNNRTNVLNILKSASMDELFDIIISNEDSKIHKPDPAPILLALDRLNIDKSNAIYIGDHENDIKAGNLANIKTGLMGYSFRLEEALKEQPTYVFNDLNHIKEFL